MILGFTTQRKGKPTYFVEKILAYKLKKYRKNFVPKIHTIRKGNRWKKGMSIQMATGVRTKNYLRFNGGEIGLDTCKNVQSIEISRVDDITYQLNPDAVYKVGVYVENLKETFYMAFTVKVDGRDLHNDEIKKLAINDGFPSPVEMFEWLDDNDFEGQLVHWTDMVY